jgi:hypothetical protein
MDDISRMERKEHDPGDAATPPKPAQPAQADQPREIGGRPGPDPTRYGDWEIDGRCIDF